MTLRLAIDCMGGDHGLTVTVPAALAFLRHTPDVGLILVGQQDRAIRLDRVGMPAEGDQLRRHFIGRQDEIGQPGADSGAGHPVEAG